MVYLKRLPAGTVTGVVPVVVVTLTVRSESLSGLNNTTAAGSSANRGAHRREIAVAPFFRRHQCKPALLEARPNIIGNQVGLDFFVGRDMGTDQNVSRQRNSPLR